MFANYNFKHLYNNFNMNELYDELAMLIKWHHEVKEAMITTCNIARFRDLDVRRQELQIAIEMVRFTIGKKLLYSNR